MYIDDLVLGSNTIEEAGVIKQKSIELFRKSKFNLHNWNSNIPLLQSSNTKSESEFSYVKGKLKNTAERIKILGVPSKKNCDNLSVVLIEFNEKLMTKKNVLSYIASTFVPLGLISTSHVIGKVSYRQLCQKKLPWDTEIYWSLPNSKQQQLKKWVNDNTNILLEIPQSFPTHKESTTSVELHVLGDASTVANYAAVYAVVN